MSNVNGLSTELPLGEKPSTMPCLTPSEERALDAALAAWEEDVRLPEADADRIRRAVLADDAAYRPLTPQWWQRVLRGSLDSGLALADARTYLKPVPARP